MGIWEQFSGQAHWVWIAAGVLLCAMEILAAGIFLLWIGLAAIATGLLMMVIPMNPTWSLIVFAVLSIGSVLLGWKLYGTKGGNSDRPFLNRRADAMIGRTYTLAQAIKSGEGSIRVNDTNWRVRGPDMPAGTKIKVSGIEDSSVLIVEQA